MADIGSWFRRQGAPVTVGMIVALVAVSLFSSVADLRSLSNLVFQVPGWAARPWTILTYPWVYPVGSGMGLLCLLFFVMWFLWTGTSVERELGSGKFAAFMAAMTVLPAILLGIAAGSLNQPLFLNGPLLPEAALTVAWCTRNQSATIMIWGILPLSGKWLGWLTAAGVFVMFGAGSAVLAVVGVAHLALAWAFAANRLPLRYGSGPAFRRPGAHATRAQAQYDESYYDDVRRREKDREERERLRKLFGDSLKDDEPR